MLDLRGQSDGSQEGECRHGRSSSFGDLIRILAVLCAGFLTLYFADSSTRLFVKHALVYDSLFFGGPGLFLTFGTSLFALILWFRYLPVYLLLLVGPVALVCMVLAEVAFRVTGVPLNTFHVSLFLQANVDGIDAAQEFQAVIASVALRCGIVLGLGLVAIRLVRWRPSGSLVGAASCLSLLILSLGSIDFEGQIFVPSPFGLAAAASHVSVASDFRERGPVTIRRVGQHPTRHFFYIVDETVRADHITLNDPERGVTPWLAAFPDVISLGPAVSTANCSVQGQYILRTGVTPSQLPDVNRNTLGMPNILAYAATSGRKTRFIDAQSSRFTNYMSKYDLAGVEAEMGLFDDVERCLDSGECRLVNRLREIASSDEPSFTYVVKAAAHWPYEIRYPDFQAVYRPDATPEDRSPDRVANSYRNAIRWNIDRFFQELLEDGSVRDYAIIYTGDHGEDLNPGPNQPPHCGHGVHIRAIEGIVPILLFTDRPELKPVFQRISDFRNGRTSQFDLFPTWLRLLGYDSREVLEKYGPSLFDETLRPLQFYSGDIFHNYGKFFPVGDLREPRHES